MNNQKKIFIFDMDGVIVDIIPSLYKVYLDFLKEYSIQGNKEEFNELNGPKLKKIIVYLKRKYSLKESEDQSKGIYKYRMNRVYESVELIKDVDKVLKELKENNIKIVLASAAKKEQIEFILKKYKLSKYFDYIVSGDMVKRAKPDPEIYDKVRERYSDHEYFVIEDSENGIQSALNAGMNVIYYNPENKTISDNISYNVHSMKELKVVLANIYSDIETVFLAKEIELRLIDYEILISNGQREYIEKIWSKTKARKLSLFNGGIVCLKSYNIQDNKLIIDCFKSQYKYFLAQLESPEVNLRIKKLAISGIIIDPNNNTLIGERKNVTEYKSYYELIPSGGLEKMNYKENILEELEEETRITKKDVLDIIPIGLLFDKKSNVYDICCKIILKINLSEIKEYSNKEYPNNNEYININIISLQKIYEYTEKFIPTSLGIIGILLK